jgi:hypothetical protein
MADEFTPKEKVRKLYDVLLINYQPFVIRNS